MFEGLVSLDNISFALVFLGGLLSFLSPCVLPLIPLYIGYLAGNAKVTNSDGSITYKRTKVLFHTVCFVLGISTAFFILGMSFTALGSFFNSNKILFTRVAGILIIVLGLFQIGFFEFKFLQREHRINVDLKDKKINPIMAYIMGFTFSFAWTPCVGPALSSVLILASSAKSAVIGNLLVLVYSLGFVIPFLLLGIFTTQVLNFIKNNKNIMKYTIKIGGVIMIIMGVMTFTGWINNISGYLSVPNTTQSTSENSKDEVKDTSQGENTETANEEQSENNEEQSNNEAQAENSKNDTNTTSSDEKQNSNEQELSDAIDFTLTDQYGNTHKLSDYKGKTVFLNFWATWCPPCRGEMPHIEELYKEFNYNKEDVIFIGVANPGGNEQDIQGIKDFLNSEGYTFPVVFDESGEVFGNYSINSLPTTFMINEEGKVYGYVSGALTKEQMKSIIEQTQNN